MPAKYAIYSTALLDGICSSAVIVRLARLRRDNYKLGTISFNTIDYDFEEMANLKDYIVFILDFPPDSVPELDKKLKDISEHNKIAYWNSHHPYTKESLEVLKKHVAIIELAGPIGSVPPEVKLCSTELACNRFLKHDFVANTLKSIAHDLEFWERKDERSSKLADIISSNAIDKKDIVESLALGVFWSERFDRIRTDYLAKKQKEQENLMKKLVIKEYADKKVGITVASTILSTADAGQYVLDNSDVNISIIIYKDGRISFRRKQGCSINLREISKLFNGGGHIYAAGGNLLIGREVPVRAINNDTFDTIVFYIDRKLSDWFYK